MSWFRKFQIETKSSDFQTTSYILTDENSFYHQLTRDLLGAKEEAIVESPYVTIPGMRSLKSVFELLIKKDII